jgi:phage baseplate assembly protein W
MTRSTVITIHYGDTLQAIAARELGDWTRWQELAELNRLRWPFLHSLGLTASDDESIPGDIRRVLNVGDRLRLPIQDDAGQEGPNLSVTPFGVDLSEDGPARELLRGLDNLQAALQRRLRTPLGYLPHHPEYGSRLRSFIGQPLNLALVLDVRAEVQRVLSLDARVSVVQNVAVDVQEDALVVTALCETELGELALLERFSHAA